jgi:hypothetical protein
MNGHATLLRIRPRRDSDFGVGAGLVARIGRCPEGYGRSRRTGRGAAIRTQILEAVAHRETFGGQLPPGDNPMDWISARPYNYIGERNGVPAESGVWFFDKNAKILVYRFRDGHLALQTQPGCRR